MVNSKITTIAISDNKSVDFFSRTFEMDEHIAINFMNTYINGESVKTIWTTPEKLINVLIENRNLILDVPKERY